MQSILNKKGRIPMRRTRAFFAPSAVFAAALALFLGQPAQAAPSPEDYDALFRLGMTEGHLVIGHELLRNKQAALAQPHFGHPVEELYGDLEPWLQDHKVPAFNTQLIALQAAVAASPYSPETEAKYQAVIAAIHKAREAAPADLRASVPEQIRICADTVDAASGEYSEAVNKGKVDAAVEYHDSRGYLMFVRATVDRLVAGNPSAADKGLIDRFRPVLARAEAIVAPLLPPEKPIATVAEYRAIAAEAKAVAK